MSFYFYWWLPIKPETYFP